MGLLNYPDQVPQDIGTDCSLCFEPGKTPKYVYAAVWDMLYGDLWVAGDMPAPNGFFRLTQISPCIWQVYYLSFSLIWTNSSGSSGFVIGTPYPETNFSDGGSVPCLTEFVNQVVSGSGVHWYSGKARIYTKEPPIQLNWSMNFVPFEDANSELWDLGNANFMQRTVRGVDNTNIIAKIDTLNL